MMFRSPQADLPGERRPARFEPVEWPIKVIPDREPVPDHEPEPAREPEREPVPA